MELTPEQLQAKHDGIALLTATLEAPDEIGTVLDGIDRSDLTLAWLAATTSVLLSYVDPDDPCDLLRRLALA